MRGSILKPQDVAKLIQRINGLYEEEGYFNSDIKALYYKYFTADTIDEKIYVRWQNTNDLADEYEVEYNASEGKSSDLITKIKERLVLKINIIEGDEVKVREIAFNNNNAFDDGDLSDEMEETSEAKWWKFWGGGKFDPKNIKRTKN